jgi:hypothetical protein
MRTILALTLTLVAGPGALPAQTLSVLSRSEVLVGQAVREPAVVRHPDGALFVAGYSRDPEEALDPPNLYRSVDGGRSWDPVDVGRVEEGASGNSDVDLKLGPDGSLYFLAMGFDREVGEGRHVALGISRDAGATWTWRYVSRSRFDDRPWIGVTSEGRAHVVWNDGRGVRHAVSADGGDTWEETERISRAGGSSHLAVGPSGEIAVRIAPGSASGIAVDPGADYIAVSEDDGASWAVHRAPGIRDWREVPRWVEPVAWGPEGVLYSLWSEGTTLRLGRSADRGASWDVQDVLQDPGTVYYPFLTAGPGGHLALSWFSGVGEELRAHVGLVDTTADVLTVRRTEPLEVDAWRESEGGRVRDPAGEYFPVIFLDGGVLAAVLPVQAAAGGEGFSWIRIGSEP